MARFSSPASLGGSLPHLLALRVFFLFCFLPCKAFTCVLRTAFPLCPKHQMSVQATGGSYAPRPCHTCGAPVLPLSHIPTGDCGSAVQIMQCGAMGGSQVPRCHELFTEPIEIFSQGYSPLAVYQRDMFILFSIFYCGCLPAITIFPPLCSE